jgi:hypothetical protein
MKILLAFMEESGLSPTWINKKHGLTEISCRKWFNEQFFPDVRKCTERPVLLLLNYAPGHFDGPLEHNGV